MWSIEIDHSLWESLWSRSVSCVVYCSQRCGAYLLRNELRDKNKHILTSIRLTDSICSCIESLWLGKVFCLPPGVLSSLPTSRARVCPNRE
ncbi:hypothetical protein CEXT_459221 [Caerostris extrusa]|uniref:Uncharacterized protein n=1 Tax=Caerostris extrusa TaxID=172846 RepID=A0AAV4Q6R3_CAEEX|nr:hypothetical protein CEXT_459221 [Caerostris extrusa]